MLLHTLLQLSRNTRNLLPCCRHTYLPHKPHSTLLAPPFLKNVIVNAGNKWKVFFSSWLCKNISLFTHSLAYNVFSFSHLVMAGRKHFTFDNDAVFFCPCTSVRVQSTRVQCAVDIWAGGWQFPAVSKLCWINYNFVASGSEIILDSPIIISTQATDFALP